MSGWRKVDANLNISKRLVHHQRPGKLPWLGHSRRHFFLRGGWANRLVWCAIAPSSS